MMIPCYILRSKYGLWKSNKGWSTGCSIPKLYVDRAYANAAAERIEKRTGIAITIADASIRYDR